MCKLATMIFCRVKMTSVCLRSNFSDKCDTDATLYPSVYDDSLNKGENSACQKVLEILPA